MNNSERIMMYRSHTYLYLVIMTCYLVSPLLPYVEYELNKEYIAKYLCVYKDIPGNSCQGKCHLQKQLENSSENDNTDKDQERNSRQDNSVNDHLMVNYLLEKLNGITSDLYYDNSFKIVNEFPDPVFEPPKV